MEKQQRTDPDGLERLGLLIARVKQPSPRHRETSEAVALRKRASRRV